MTQLSNQAPAELFNFDPKDYPDLQVKREVYTVTNQGKWRQYDDEILKTPCIAFSKILGLSLRTNNKNDEFLRLDLATGRRLWAIENRTDFRGVLPTRSHSLMQALLGLNANHGTLSTCCGFFKAGLGTKPGSDGIPGVFINVTDMTTGIPQGVPRKLLDRNLSTGDFYTAVEMLKEAIKPY